MTALSRRVPLRAFAVVVLVAFLAGCTTIDPVTGDKVWNMYSLDEDVTLGQSALQANTEQMRDANVRIDDDPQRVAQLQEMVNRLAAVSDLPQLPYTVTLYHTNIVNAAAAPGGSMMVFEGLYGKEGLVDPNDENELAAVMAHEVAHVNSRHVTERLTKLKIGTAVAQIGAVVASASDEKDLAAIIQGAFVVGTSLWIPSYTRKNEVEADRVGLFYMARAGYDPRAAPRIWKKAAEQKGEKDKTSIFSTHPASKERQKALLKLLPYAMDEYARATGGYPSGYVLPEGHTPLTDTESWRRPSK